MHTKYNPIGNQVPKTPHYQDYHTIHNWEVNKHYVRGEAQDSFVRSPSCPGIDNSTGKWMHVLLYITWYLVANLQETYNPKPIQLPFTIVLD